MNFEEKLRRGLKKELWNEYCGFLDLDIDSYMRIQYRLMEEQIRMWTASGLGKALLGKSVSSVEEFREVMPLTDYNDYADILLNKRADMLPDEPIIWIQTTWEGGKHPIKVAPYTRGMLDVFKNNVLACMIMSCAEGRGKFNLKPGDKMLYALAPLPYATGLFPVALDEELYIEFLPPVKEAVSMSFSERNKKGFKLGMNKGIDFFFGLGSVAYYVSTSLSAVTSGGSRSKTKDAQRAADKTHVPMTPAAALRYLRAKMRAAREGREILPRDLFKLKGFMVAGTDNACYRDDLERMWGVRPLELFAGTEPSCIGTETWSRSGFYLFPDTCFYEFIPESEMEKNLADPGYKPCTCLLNEVRPGEKYELVISVFKGGAFMRYRVGDVYRCVGLENPEDGTKIPRFNYVDRIPTVIDIAGFTRITENSISDVIEVSGLGVADWVAAKEFTETKRPFLHMYVELSREAVTSGAVSREILRDRLTIYFKYVDSDYNDLKRILGIDPLEITVLRCGTFEEYGRKFGKISRRINPDPLEIRRLLEISK
ncbi:MAG TPA: GH3 auxin-responsive promoter family protein [Bacillota bacterium]|nr:GH3 auxin-responsive promoter family protein [Clostridiales bacterium]HPT84457.1 GH3 auxin-responsive promoter family protein [Bacillota bacterium]